MSSESDYKKTILKLVNDARLSALRADRRATAELAAHEAGHKVWKEENPEDGIGGMSGNPYNPDRRKEWADDARAHHKYMDEVYQFAVTTFVED